MVIEVLGRSNDTNLFLIILGLAPFSAKPSNFESIYWNSMINIAIEWMENEQERWNKLSA